MWSYDDLQRASDLLRVDVVLKKWVDRWDTSIASQIDHHRRTPESPLALLDSRVVDPETSDDIWSHIHSLDADIDALRKIGHKFESGRAYPAEVESASSSLEGIQHRIETLLDDYAFLLDGTTSVQPRHVDAVDSIRNTLKRLLDQAERLQRAFEDLLDTTEDRAASRRARLRRPTLWSAP